MSKKALYAVIVVFLVSILCGVYIFREASDKDNAFENKKTPATLHSDNIPRAPQITQILPGVRRVGLSWYPVDKAEFYRIYYATHKEVNPTSGTLINQPPNPFVHYGLIPGQTYYYIVTAVNQYGESPVSREVAATPFAENQAGESATSPSVNFEVDGPPPQSEWPDAESTYEDFEPDVPPPPEEWPGAQAPIDDFEPEQVPPPEEWPDAGEPAMNLNEEQPPPRDQWPDAEDYKRLTGRDGP